MAKLATSGGVEKYLIFGILTYTMRDDIKLSVGVIAGTLVLLAGIVLVVRLIDAPTDLNVNDTIGPRRNVIGSPEAPNVIVEFSDFQCPACAAVDRDVRGFIEEFGSSVSLEYRHFTLPQHANALPSAYAAEAAGNQGKFWEAHNWLFDNQSVWEDETTSAEYFYAQFGSSLGLDEERFVKDYNSDEVRQKVADDTSAASRLRLDSTPTFFINGKKQVGGINREGLIKLLGLTVTTPVSTPELSPTVVQTDDVSQAP